MPSDGGIFPIVSDEIPDGKRFAQVHWLKLPTLGKHLPLATQGYSSAFQNTVSAIEPKHSHIGSEINRR